MLYALDDGTGFIQCIKFFASDSRPSGYPDDDVLGTTAASAQQLLPLGALVRVRGTLSRYHGATELKVVGDLTDLRRDPNAEVVHWLDAIDLTQSLYHQPLVHDAATAAAVRGRGLHAPSCACGGGGRVYWNDATMGPSSQAPSSTLSFTYTRAELHYCFCTATADERRDPGLAFRMELLGHLSRAARDGGRVLRVPYPDLVAACDASEPSSASSSSQVGGLGSAAPTGRLAEVAFRVAAASASAPAASSSLPPSSSSLAAERQRVRNLLRITLAALRQDGLLFHDEVPDADDFLDSAHYLAPLLEACLDEFEGTAAPAGASGPAVGGGGATGSGGSGGALLAPGAVSLSAVPTVDGLRALAAARDPRVQCVPDSRIKICLEAVRRQRARGPAGVPSAGPAGAARGVPQLSARGVEVLSS
jgi:hypothetical protein